MEQYLPYILVITVGLVVLKKFIDSRHFTRFWFAGDSIMKRTEAPGKLRNDNWQPNFERLGMYSVVMNTAKGGRTTSEILKKQVTWLNIIKAKLQGVSVVVTDGGINDILKGVPEETTIDNLNKIRNKLQKAGFTHIQLKIHDCDWEVKTQRLKSQRINDKIEGVKPILRVDTHLIDRYHPNAMGKDSLGLITHKQYQRKLLGHD